MMRRNLTNDVCVHIHIHHTQIHSSLPGDRAIVYDNTDPNLRMGDRVPPRFEDDCISIHTGKAHLSPRPFHQSPIWGWGDAWRDRREFVGQLNYGVLYKLWQPEKHTLFGNNFHRATESILLAQRRYESPVSLLPDECVYYILNMCRWDWFEDSGRNMKVRARARKQRLRALEQQAGPQQPQQEAEDVTMREAENNIDNEEEEEEDAVMDDGGNGDDEDEDDGDDDDEEEEESEDELWERANGYRANTHSFQFRDISSDEESDEEENDDNNDEAAPRNWMRRQFARIRVVRFPHRHHGRMESSSSDDSDSDFEP